MSFLAFKAYFSKTIFYTAIGFSNKQFYTFNNLEEFRNFGKSNKLLLKLSRMTMSENFDNTLDLFIGIIGEIHLSSRLSKEMQDNKLTGVNIFDDKEPFVIAP